MKELAAGMVIFILMISTARYSYQIYRKQINPTLSSWIIFLIGTGLSLITYMVAENQDMKSGVLNATSIINISITILVILKWGNRGVIFKPFEKWYLAAAVVIVVYWALTSDTWTSNLIMQGLITVGYIPIVQKFITEKKNTESFTAWGLFMLASIIALYPAIDNGNDLAVIYAIRTIVTVTLMLALMVIIEIRERIK